MKQILNTNMFCAAATTIALLASCTGVNAQKLTMIVGTYTGGSSEGLYVYRFDGGDLSATPLSKATIDNPSYLTVSPDAKFIYAVSESGAENSAVSAFSFNKANGEMQFLNKVKVGADPCFIVSDNQRRFVATADYSGGSVSFIPVEKDGRLKPVAIHSKFDGAGTDSIRQTQSHVHCIAIAPDDNMLYATDLGLDQIHEIKINFNSDNSFTLETVFNTELAPRSGPRHLIFNNKGTRAYVINELSGMVNVYKMEAGKHPVEMQSIIADTCRAGGSADIHLSPDEKHLYVSTRVKGDGIVIFKVAPDGTLQRVGYAKTGKHPRNFAITPDGKLMLVACQNSGMIQIFRIDKKTGLIADTGKNILVDRPVCIKFVE